MVVVRGFIVLFLSFFQCCCNRLFLLQLFFCYFVFVVVVVVVVAVIMLINQVKLALFSSPVFITSFSLE